MAESYHTKPEVWSRAAPDYEDMFLPVSSRVAAAALPRIGLKAGDHFLDVAAGTGAVTLLPAEAGARVTAVDYSDGMLHFLREKLEDTGFDEVVTYVMDGQALDFEDNSFDAAGSNLGLVFFEDPVAGLREMARVVRPGGQVFITSLSQSKPSVLASLIGKAISRVAPDFEPTGPVARYNLASQDEMRQGLDGAGFGQVEVQLLEVAWPVGDYAEYWDRWVMGTPPSKAAMQQLDSDLVPKAKSEYVALCRQEEQKYPDGFPVLFVIGIGIV